MANLGNLLVTGSARFLNKIKGTVENADKVNNLTVQTAVPANAVFTDTNNAVTQTATSTNANYEVLFSSTADNTTRTEGARKYSNLLFNPSTGNLQATQLNGVTIGSSPKFTDTNNAVTQTATSTSADYEVLFSSTADNTTRTEGARKNSNLKFNPSTGTLTATKFVGDISGGIGLTSSQVTTALGYTPPTADTHYTTHLYVGASNGTTNAATTNGNTYLIALDNSTARDRRKIAGTQGINVTSDSSGNISIGEHYVDVTNTLSTTADTTYTFTDSRITTNSAIDIYSSIFGVNPKSMTVATGSVTAIFPKYSSAASMTARIYIK